MQALGTNAKRKGAGIGLGAAAAILAVVLLLPSLSAVNAGIGFAGTSTSPILTMSEDMPAFLNGTVVQTQYEQGYFVGANLTHVVSSGPEPLLGVPRLGASPTIDPTRATTISPLWVLVPWWGNSSAPYAPAYDPAAYGIDVQCAPATLGVCFDHPATIVVPGLGTVPLPGHDHLIATTASGADIWWNVVVVLVLKASAWPMISPFGESGITSLAELQSAQSAGTASATLPTNFFLNFQVLGQGSAKTPGPSPTLRMAETMPAFVDGLVDQTVYKQGYFVGTNVTYNVSSGPEPLFGVPEAGTAATVLPAPARDIAPLWVLVPWWGSGGTPYAPAYDPAAYGIDVQCAPATQGVCFDHPATITVPGLGTVPLPGHDHLIGTTAGGHDIWWDVIIVLVLNASAWPMVSPFAETGITSVAALHAAQSMGTASGDIPTNVFLNFAA